MKEHYVSYEQSVKLKELGFEENGLKNYIRQGYYKFPNGNISPIKHDGDGILVQFRKENAERIPAPRLDQAAAWLREVKGIFVGVTYDNNMSNYNPYGFRVQIPMCNDRSALGFHEYNQALSAGIDKALELLGKEVKE